MSGITVTGRIHQGSFHLTTELRTDPGAVVAVTGPNGSGKTTLLRAVAGHVALDEGRIAIGPDVVDEPEARAWTPPYERRVGAVPADGLLFPHLDAVDNVAFGLRRQGVSRKPARARAGETLEQLGLDVPLDRKPDALSTGQRQRVALARAIVLEPAALLLDEAFSAIDAGARAAVRRATLAARPEPCAVLLVTHDPVEIVAVADRVHELGSEADAAARALAPTVLTGVADGSIVELDAGGQLVVVDLSAPSVAAGAVAVVVEPGAVTLHRQPPRSSARNAWSVRVTNLQRAGAAMRIELVGPPNVAALVTTETVAELDLRPGEQVWASAKATELSMVPI